MYPETLRNFVKGCYINGLSVWVIHIMARGNDSYFRKSEDSKLSLSTIYRWIKKYDWKEIKNDPQKSALYNRERKGMRMNYIKNRRKK